MLRVGVLTITYEGKPSPVIPRTPSAQLFREAYGCATAFSQFTTFASAALMPHSANTTKIIIIYNIYY